MAGKGDKDRTLDKEAFDTRFDAIRWPLRDAKSKDAPTTMQHRCGAFKCPLSSRCARRAMPSKPGASRCDFSHGLNEDRTECAYRRMWAHGVEVK